MFGPNLKQDFCQFVFDLYAKNQKKYCKLPVKIQYFTVVFPRRVAALWWHFELRNPSAETSDCQLEGAAVQMSPRFQN